MFNDMDDNDWYKMQGIIQKQEKEIENLIKLLCECSGRVNRATWHLIANVVKQWCVTSGWKWFGMPGCEILLLPPSVCPPRWFSQS